MTEISIPTSDRTEFVSITDRVAEVVAESGVRSGLCCVYVPHTTAAVTVNESADPMVARDVLHVIDNTIPFSDPEYRHLEGNSAAHVKAILVGTSETLIVRDSRLVLGTWQGIFFFEFDGPRQRKAYVKLIPDTSVS